MGKHTDGTGDIAEKASGRRQSLKNQGVQKVKVKVLLLLHPAHLSGCVYTHATG